MSANTFGRLFRVTTFGESHGPAVGCVIDGMIPGLRISPESIQRDLDRRRPGQSVVTSARSEKDRVEILSGTFEGLSTGAPLTMLVRNEDSRPGDYDHLARVLRPGHADMTWLRKYGIRDHRGGGRSSGRETVARVAAGAVARQILSTRGVSILGHVVSIGEIRAATFDPDEIERNAVRCADADTAEEMIRTLAAIREQGDSLGGMVEVVARGVPSGWGDPVFDKLDAVLAAAMMSIGAVKGVEIGDGFSCTSMRGSACNDPLGPDGPESNRHGGILGGISSGTEVVVRLAVKPTPSIAVEQRTVDTGGEPTTVSVRGRHDPCICPRIVPVSEAMAAIALTDAMMRHAAISNDEGGPS